jgi:hypothetical protein
MESNFKLEKYGCLKTTRCSEDSFMVGKHGKTRDDSDTWDNATSANSKLKCKDRVSF